MGEKRGERSNAQDGKDGDRAGGSGRAGVGIKEVKRAILGMERMELEGERHAVALPHAQGRSVSLAQIWSSPLQGGPCEYRLHQQISTATRKALEGFCIRVCYPACAEVVQGSESWSVRRDEAIRRKDAQLLVSLSLPPCRSWVPCAES